MRTMPYHIEVLSKELQRRSAANPRFSLRAFAARLGLHPSALSRVLALKQRLSSGAALCAAEKLGLTREEKRLFFRSVAETLHAEEARALGEKIDAPELRPQPAVLSAEKCAEVFNLRAHAILALTEVEGFRPDPEWIARRLDQPAEEVARTLRALVDLGLLRERENGRLEKAELHWTAIDNEETCRIRREHQTSILDRAARSLEQDAFDSRAHYAATMSIDPEKLPKAREMILKFLESLDDFLESGEKKRVYQASIQLFPLDSAEANDM